MLGSILDASHTVSVEQLPELVGECVAHLALHDLVIYVVDLQQTTLHLLTGIGSDAGARSGREPAELPVEGTTAGKAFQYLDNFWEPADERWWVPLLDGTERVGALGACAQPSDEEAVESLRQVAALVALMVVSRQSSSDSYARLVRSRSMNVAAEMQWSLMPPQTFTNGPVTIGAVFEPAYEISGDVFDYALSGDTAHLAVFDAMGHNVSSGITANLAVAASRNSRRQGARLGEIGGAIEDVLLNEFGDLRYVTALLADLHMDSGVLDWVSHGHYPPVIIRGDHWVPAHGGTPGHPLGTDLDVPAAVCHEQLQPGDRVLLYTDGITELRSNPEDPDSEFGLERLLDFLISHNGEHLSVPELLRRALRSVVSYNRGQLQDDATILVMEWRGTAYRRLQP